MATLTKLLEGNISCAAFNGDSTRLALCPNNNTLRIYNYDGKGWVLDKVLEDHQLLITGVDWDPVRNRIVTCSEDRNAYVYDEVDGEWRPSLVILRINRAATCVKWSPDGSKFAVGTSDKKVSVCYLDQQSGSNWWISVHLKEGIKGTVLSVAWNPDNIHLAVGTVTRNVIVYSTYSPDLGDPEGEEYDAFGTALQVIPFKGWVNHVDWSPAGDCLFAAAHNSVVCFTYSGSDPQYIPVKDLPYKTGCFLSDNVYVAAGWDYNPVCFALGDQGWEYVGKIDTPAFGTKDSGRSRKTGGFSKMSSFWSDKVDRGSDRGAGSTKSKVSTKHKNCIYEAIPLENSLVTVGLGGYMVSWPYDKMEEVLKVKFRN